MIIKLNENSAINSDYIINLYLKHNKDKYDVIARMIDGTLLLLKSFDIDEEAQKEYNRIVDESNRSIK